MKVRRRTIMRAGLVELNQFRIENFVVSCAWKSRCSLKGEIRGAVASTATVIADQFLIENIEKLMNSKIAPHCNRCTINYRIEEPYQTEFWVNKNLQQFSFTNFKFLQWGIWRMRFIQNIKRKLKWHFNVYLTEW